MAERKSSGRRRPSKDTASTVIDVGDAPVDGEAEPSEASERDEDAEPEGGAEDGVDTDLASGARASVDADDDVREEPAGADVDVESQGGGEDVKPARVERGLARRDPMSIYMSETRRFPLLSAEDEHALAVKLVAHNDTASARKLVEANLRLVVKIAYEYRRAHRNLLDLVQEGNIGLIQAVSKFDPYRGVKLSSYAAFWIRAYILKFILNNWRLVKIGTTQAQRKLFFNLRKEREKLEQLGFQATTKLLAEKLDVPEREVIDMERRLAAPEASLDAPIGNGDDGDGTRTRLDYMPSDGDRPDQAYAATEFKELLKSKLETFAATLEGREQTIFRDRWLTEDPKTLQEIGDTYSISRERARQLEKRMLDRLKKYLESELGTSIDIAAMSRE